MEMYKNQRKRATFKAVGSDKYSLTFKMGEKSDTYGPFTLGEEFEAHSTDGSPIKVGNEQNE